MRAFDVEKSKVDMGSVMVKPPIVVPITPRLMRTVPSNIARVIGNFEEVETTE